ncbi:MAG: LacI family transcriptional regulator [Prolixibacteraceae bacterium]|nr:LacI family transcriptional regulator [Prolixibacteraceae bacterium]
MQAAKPTIQQISNTTGYSVSTVSRVLNGYSRQYRISEKAQKLIKKKAEELNYKPNQMARGLRLKRTFTIGLVIPDFANPFFAIMAKHIEKAASLSDYSILLVDSDENAEKEKQQIKNMIARDIDGIIVAPVGTEKNHFNDIIKQKIPLLFIDRYFPDMDVPFLSSDNFRGAYDAIKLFIRNGHKKIAIIKGDNRIEPVKERLRGYINALKESGINVCEKFIAGNGFSPENGYHTTLELLELPEKPTAILAMSNLIGLGVLQALNEKNMSIPSDMSFIVFDDQPYVSYLNPPVTTVKQNSEMIGKMAFELLLKKISDPGHTPSSQLIPTAIIERRSISQQK